VLERVPLHCPERCLIVPAGHEVGRTENQEEDAR